MFKCTCNVIAIVTKMFRGATGQASLEINKYFEQCQEWEIHKRTRKNNGLLLQTKQDVC